MKKFYFAFTILLFVVLISCHDNFVEPIAPGSRNYIWKSDTLKQLTPFDHLYNIWGSSESDVWVSGSGGMFHYNGTNWQEYKGMRWNLDCLYGFAKYDIWTFASGNYNGANIWHYDGTSWKDLGLYAFTTTDGFLGINDVRGSGSNSIYAVGIFMFGKGGGGRKAVMMHYNGAKWEFINTGELKTNMYSICYDNRKNKYYINGEEEKWDTTGSVPLNTENIKKIYEYDGKNLNEIYSNKDIVKYAVQINGEVYFTGENKLWTYSNNSFQVIHDFSGYPYTFGNVRGRSEKDLFIYSIKKNGSAWPRYITHYNGTDIVLLYENEDIWAYEIIGNDIFVVATDKIGQCIISHGRLQK